MSSLLEPQYENLRQEIRSFIETYLMEQGIPSVGESPVPGEQKNYWRFIYHDFIGHFLIYDLSRFEVDTSPWLHLRLDLARIPSRDDHIAYQAAIQALKMNADSETVGCLAIFDDGVISNAVNLPLADLSMTMIKREIGGFLKSCEAAFSILKFYYPTLRSIR